LALELNRCAAKRPLPAVVVCRAGGVDAPPELRDGTLDAATTVLTGADPAGSAIRVFDARSDAAITVVGTVGEVEAVALAIAVVVHEALKIIVHLPRFPRRVALG
jgi:hypothetical protein